jgi:hypothetical protein
MADEQASCNALADDRSFTATRTFLAGIFDERGQTP